MWHKILAVLKGEPQRKEFENKPEGLNRRFEWIVELPLGPRLVPATSVRAAPTADSLYATCRPTKPPPLLLLLVKPLSAEV